MACLSFVSRDLYLSHYNFLVKWQKHWTESNLFWSQEETQLFSAFIIFKHRSTEVSNSSCVLIGWHNAAQSCQTSVGCGPARRMVREEGLVIMVSGLRMTSHYNSWSLLLYISCWQSYYPVLDKVLSSQYQVKQGDSRNTDINCQGSHKVLLSTYI